MLLVVMVVHIRVSKCRYVLWWSVTQALFVVWWFNFFMFVRILV